MRKALLVCMLLSLVGFAVESDAEVKQTKSNLEASMVTAPRLKIWLEAAKYKASIDKDGDLLCKTEDGKSFYVILDDERQMLKFKSGWGKPKDVSIKALKNMANSFNHDKIFVNVSIDEEGDSSVEYFMVYNGGLNRTNFLESLDWFIKIDQAWANTVKEVLD